jgi:hypothetical protein
MPIPNEQFDHLCARYLLGDNAEPDSVQARSYDDAFAEALQALNDPPLEDIVIAHSLGVTFRVEGHEPEPAAFREDYERDYLIANNRYMGTCPLPTNAL